MNTDLCSFLNFQQIVPVGYGKILVDERSLCEILNRIFFFLLVLQKFDNCLNVPSVQRP